ncbi:tetratricopeptide repeat protein [Azospirillum sp. sgz302134]
MLAFLSVAVPIHAQPADAVRVEATRGEKGARLSLRWPGSVTVEHSLDGRELSLRASRPLGEAPLEGIPDRLQGWVDNVLYGYDSVLLVLAPGVTAEITDEPSGLRIDLAQERRTTRRTAEDMAAEQAAQRRIDYFRAVTLMEQGDVREARSLLVDLLRANPNDAQSTALLAQAEERIGRWREAVRLYDRALELTPDEPSLVVGKANLLREHGEQARFDWDLFQVQNADVQRIGRLTGNLEVGGNTSFLYALEHRAVDVDQAVRADGRVEPFHGNRQRAELALQHDWPELQRSRFALFAAPRTVGAGYVHAWRDEESETRAGLLWSEPNFTFIEGIVGAGRRDRAYLQHQEQLTERWSFELGAGVNRYGLAGDSDLARSATVEGAIRYVLNREGPVTSVAYLLDAEYVSRREERFNEAGAIYHPLPVQTREVHALQLSVDDALTDYWRYSIQGGYAYDRRSKGGPQGAVSLAYEPLENLELGLRASYTRSTARGNGAAATAAGGYVTFRY